MSLEDWRRLNVEQYDPDLQYEEDPIPNARPDLTIADMQTLSQSLRTYVQKGATLDGIKSIMEFAPYGAEEQVREAYLRIAFEALISVRVTDITQIVNQMDLDESDYVIKLAYSLMKNEWALKQAGILLVWIDKIVEKIGEGPIMRYINDPAQL